MERNFFTTPLSSSCPLFHGFFDKACIVGILPRFLECLVCSATPKTKTTFGILQLWFNYFTTVFQQMLMWKFPKSIAGHISPRVWDSCFKCWDTNTVFQKPLRNNRRSSGIDGKTSDCLSRNSSYYRYIELRLNRLNLRLLFIRVFTPLQFVFLFAASGLKRLICSRSCQHQQNKGEGCSPQPQQNA